MTRRIKRPQSTEESISLPYNYTPRGYQLSVLHALDTGKRRGVLVWHRRPARTRPCYYHIFRTFNQGWWVQIQKTFITLTPTLSHRGRGSSERIGATGSSEWTGKPEWVERSLGRGAQL